MEEQFVPYELALKLKKLGFDENTLVGYTLWQNPTLKEPTLLLHIPTGKYFKHSPIPNYNKYSHRTNNIVKAPLWQQAFDWFREKHDLILGIAVYNKEFVEQGLAKPFEPQIINGEKCLWGGEYNDYEEARQACLEKLIEIYEQRKTNS